MLTALTLGEMLMPVFYQVLNMSITASYIFVILVVCRLILKKAPKVYCYALWFVMLFRLLCPVTVPSPISALNMLHLEDGQNQIIMEYISPEIELADNPTVGLGIPALSEQVNQLLPAPSPQHSATPMQIRIFSYSTLWVLGIFAFMIYTMVSSVRMSRLIGTAILVEPGVYACESLASPFVKGIFYKGTLAKGLFGMGLLQAKIYLPSHLSDEERQIVLAHEYAHLRRWDPLMKGLFFAALVIHWFNPLVWAAFFLMNRDMEMSCDEAVLRQQSRQTENTVRHHAAQYSAILLNMASKEAGLKTVSPFGPLAFGESSVSARIKHALKFHPVSFRSKLVLTVVCAAVMLACSCNPTGKGVRLSDRVDYYMNRLIRYWSMSTTGEPTVQERLWEHRTPYIGDNSAVGNLLGALTVPEEWQIHSDGMILETDVRPYRLIIRYRCEASDMANHTIGGQDSNWIYQNMALLFGVIDNADIIETRIAFGEDEMLYCPMTRFQVSYAIEGNMDSDIVLTSRQEWDNYVHIVRGIDFKERGTIIAGEDPDYQQRRYLTGVVQEFGEPHQTITMVGQYNREAAADSLFVVERDGLTYDEYGNVILPREIQPGDRLLIGYLKETEGTMISSFDTVYVQVVPWWFAHGSAH